MSQILSIIHVHFYLVNKALNLYNVGNVGNVGMVRQVEVNRS